MSAQDRFEHSLPDRLEALAAPRTPSYYDDVIHTTARTRQRPGWSFPERWLPMSAITDRLATAPRAPMRVIAVAALVILALAALFLVAGGSRRPNVPAPFGVAANGRIAWVDNTGAIVVAASGTEPATIVPGPGNRAPLFSPDGTRLLYLHDTGGGTDVIVAAANGSDPVTVASAPAYNGTFWAPDSRSLVLAEGGTLTRVEARPGATPVVLATGVADTYDWRAESAMLFRPPAGDEIAYLRQTESGKAIILAKADGSSPREILTPAGGLGYRDLHGLRWSPDGTRLAVVLTMDASGAETAVYIVNADGSGLRSMSDRTVPGKIVRDSNPAWSPDGRFIVMQTWFADAQQEDQQETRPLTVVEVATAEAREVGSVSMNGFNSFAWSPDGVSILVVPDSGRIATIDVATGRSRSDAWQSESGATWQRVAP
jgi:hypothetical protein